jgi:hypothetical protein
MRVTNPSVDGKQGATFNNIDTRGPIGQQSTAEGVYLAWADSRATDANGDAEDAYFARIRHSPEVFAGSSERPAWLWGALGAAVTLVVGGVVLAVGVRRSTRAPGRRAKAVATAG